jgi:hypothetical protein
MTQAVPEICQLVHPGFRKLGEPVFRLTGGTARVASMVILLEKQEAVLPLRSIAREFRVDPESPDGKMLELIEQALDFVVSIRLGDKLPSELFGGEASWEPNDNDRVAASSRVRHNLVRCMLARMGRSDTISGAGAPGWEEQPQNQELLRQAIAAAATELDGTDAADVMARVALLSAEVAYIESMRRLNSRGIGAMREKLLGFSLGQVPTSRRDTFKQVQALSRRGLDQISTRFDDVDVRLDDVLVIMRDVPAAVGWLRHQRDLLFRINYAWAGVFADWERAPKHYNDFFAKAVERTYLFLAPRFMTFQEWATQESRQKQEPVQTRVW